MIWKKILYSKNKEIPKMTKIKDYNRNADFSYKDGHQLMHECEMLALARIYKSNKTNKEKLIENFLRRFAENASLSTTYTIKFYGIYEAPPKVSIEVKGKSNSFTVVAGEDATDFDIVNRIDSILEGNKVEE